MSRWQEQQLFPTHCQKQTCTAVAGRAATSAAPPAGLAAAGMQPCAPPAVKAVDYSTPSKLSCGALAIRCPSPTPPTSSPSLLGAEWRLKDINLNREMVFSTQVHGILPKGFPPDVIPTRAFAVDLPLSGFGQPKASSVYIFVSCGVHKQDTSSFGMYPRKFARENCRKRN